MRTPRVLLAAIALVAVTSCASVKSARNAASSTAAAPTGVVARSTPPNCHGEPVVWAIQGAKVYLLPGDRLYGKTKRGEYLCSDQAHAEGFRSARQPLGPR
jgi:hypothetical protein